FFFQAEDGIRDFHVTGVQTCALPISQIVLFTTGKGTPTGSSIAPVVKISSNNRTFEHLNEDTDFSAGDILEGTKTIQQVGHEIRSEERRVGKERSRRRSPIRRRTETR